MAWERKTPGHRWDGVLSTVRDRHSHRWPSEEETASGDKNLQTGHVCSKSELFHEHDRLLFAKGPK